MARAMTSVMERFMLSKPRASRVLSTLGLGGVLLIAGCGGDEAEVTQQRGAPQLSNGGSKKKQSGTKKTRRTSKPSGSGVRNGGDEEVDFGPRPDRERTLLDRTSFAGRTRDPFQSFKVADALEEATVAVVQPRSRKVELSQYDFGDLTLITTVQSSRGITPRAQFLATDGKSKVVRQGEYFSRAEVLLAAVNRDYIEIEVVDEELAEGLNMAAGERRAIYLKDE